MKRTQISRDMARFWLVFALALISVGHLIAACALVAKLTAGVR